MPLSTKMWLREGCVKIYTKMNAHKCRPDDGHRWQFAWAQDGMIISGGGLPYGELDTDYADGWHNMRPLQLPLPDRPFDLFHIVHNRFWEAMWTPAVYQMTLATLLVPTSCTEINFGKYWVSVSAERLTHIIQGLNDTAYIHTPDESIFWITDGKRFALLGFA